MYFIHYFYVSVTDDAPKFPGAESPASSWPCAELSRRRIARVELALRRIVPSPSWRRRIGGAELSHSAEDVLSTVDMVVQRRDGPRWLRHSESDDDDDELHYYWGLYNVWDPSANYWGPGPSRIDAHGLQLTRQGFYRDTVHTATH